MNVSECVCVGLCMHKCVCAECWPVALNAVLRSKTVVCVRECALTGRHCVFVVVVRIVA